MTFHQVGPLSFNRFRVVARDCSSVDFPQSPTRSFRLVGLMDGGILGFCVLEMRNYCRPLAAREMNAVQALLK